jgi:hypothetical protein
MAETSTGLAYPSQRLRAQLDYRPRTSTRTHMCWYAWLDKVLILTRELLIWAQRCCIL